MPAIPFRHPLIATLAAAALIVASTPVLAQRATAHKKGAIETCTYHFEEAERDMEYCLFVPKGYDGKKATPLVVLLHGLNSNPKQVMGYRGVTNEAGKRGYIVVAPYGYNGRGWYGARGKGKDGPFFGRRNDPDNLGELSEKDVLNVLEIVRENYKIDEQRIYLMGHSMGGAGTIHLGAAHPDIWAALAPLAPALDARTERLKVMKHIPVKIVTGDADRLVKVAIVRRWVAAMKKLDMDHDYVEIEGGDHVTSIARNAEMIAGVFDFFDQKRRAAGKRAGKSKAKKQKAQKQKASGRQPATVGR